MTVSPENKALAAHLRSVVGGRPTVTKYWDDARRSSVDMMAVEDVPETGVSTLATLGLSDTPIALESGGKPLRVELLMAARSAQRDGANILATCAFNVINSGMSIRPGTIFPRVVELYRPDSAMVHILFSTPYLWNLQTQRFDSKLVAWLLAVPISDAEHDFARVNGADALETSLEEREIDIFDLDRASVM